MKFSALSLYKGHVRNSRKILFVSCLGLICSLTIISSTNYYFDNSKKSIMEEYFVNYSDTVNDYYYSSDVFISFIKKPPDNINLKEQAIKKVTDLQNEYKINFFKSITSMEYLSGLFIPVHDAYNNYSISIQVVQLDNESFKDLTQLIYLNPLFPNSRIPVADSKYPEIFPVFFSPLLSVYHESGYLA